MPNLAKYVVTAGENRGFRGELLGVHNGTARIKRGKQIVCTSDYCQYAILLDRAILQDDSEALDLLGAKPRKRVLKTSIVEPELRGIPTADCIRLLAELDEPTTYPNRSIEYRINNPLESILRYSSAFGRPYLRYLYFDITSGGQSADNVETLYDLKSGRIVVNYNWRHDEKFASGTPKTLSADIVASYNGPTFNFANYKYFIRQYVTGNSSLFAVFVLRSIATIESALENLKK